MIEIWTEKYRPKKLSDIVGQEHIVKSLMAYNSSGTIPHMLFAGPAGTGKTTSALALAREFYGDSYRNNFEELNASDERGLDVVRGRIKNFARTAPIGEASFKIIFLDEADALTSDAQAALRRTMEKYTSTCRFILSCNYSSKIIEPIQSRCVVFRFSPVSDEDIRKYLQRIAELETLNLSSDGLDSILYVASGDMRKAVNSLQVTASFSTDITSETVYKMASVAKPEIAKKMVEASLKGDFLSARSILDSLLIEQGLSAVDILKGVHNIIFSLDIPEIKKAKIIDRIGEIEFRVVEGANERIQLEALIASIASIGFS
jgi:replication factor C small subunit